MHWRPIQGLNCFPFFFVFLFGHFALLFHGGVKQIVQKKTKALVGRAACAVIIHIFFSLNTQISDVFFAVIIVLHATGQLDDSGRRAQKDEKCHAKKCALPFLRDISKFRHSAFRSLTVVLLREVSNHDEDGLAHAEMYKTRIKQMYYLCKAVGLFFFNSKSIVYCSSRWRRGLLKLEMLNSLCYDIALKQYYHLLHVWRKMIVCCTFDRTK